MREYRKTKDLQDNRVREYYVGCVSSRISTKVLHLTIDKTTTYGMFEGGGASREGVRSAPLSAQSTTVARWGAPQRHAPHLGGLRPLQDWLPGDSALTQERAEPPTSALAAQ
jgi:hypothetical protein